MFEKYYESLVAYVRSHSNDLQVAEDIVQQCYCKFWEKRHQLKSLESPKSYLYKMAYNTYINHYRSNKRKDHLAQKIQGETILSLAFEDEEKNDAQLKELHRAIELLPTRCRNILVMSKLQGMSYKEIAEEMDISVKTVEAQMRVAFQKIRENFNMDVFIMLMFAENNVNHV